MNEMSPESIVKLITSLVLVLLALPARTWVDKALDRFGRVREFNPHKRAYTGKLTRALVTILFILALVAVWGVPLKNVWVVVTSVVGIIAIAFFAVWSILSNMVAGVLIFLLEPFQIGDQIQIVADERFGGTVRDVQLLFVEVEAAEGGVLRIPNNLFFQKVIRIRPAGTAEKPG